MTTLDDELRGKPAELTEEHVLEFDAEGNVLEPSEDAAGELALLGPTPGTPAPAANNRPDYAYAEQWSHAFVASGLFPNVHKQSVGIVKIAAGVELGVGPFAAMNNIDIIKGKLVMNANLQRALVQNHPRYAYRILEWTEEKCVMEWYEDDEIVGQSSFTIQEAERAGLRGDNWRKYPKAMLLARATSQGTRAFTPAILGGNVYAEGELE